jgi:hypothetical protein
MKGIGMAADGVDSLVGGAFDHSGELYWLNDQERENTHDFGIRLRAYAEQLETFWNKHGKEVKGGVLERGIDAEGLKELYGIIQNSNLGPVAPYSKIEHGLANRSSAEALSAEELWRWGADVNRFSPRVAGTQGMDDASDYILEKLQSFGVQAWEEPLNFRGVFFHEWSFAIKLPNGKSESFAAFPGNNVGFGDVTAPLVYVGRGESAADYEGLDVNGKIVLVDWGTIDDEMFSDVVQERNRMLHLYDLAYIHGAAAMVGFYSDTPGNVLKIIEPGIKPIGGSNVWGQGETGPDAQQRLPALNIGRDDGHALIRLLQDRQRQNDSTQRDAPVLGHVVVNGVRKVSTTKIVAGVLPGLSDEIVGVGCHSDTAFAGGVCDTCGIVGTLALAKHFASQPLSKRRKSIFFFFDSFHVWGNCCQVANQLLARHTTVAGQTTSFLWLDHFSDGKADTEGVAVVQNNPEYWPLLALALARRGIKPTAIPAAHHYSMCATGAYQRRGVPTMTIQKFNGDLLSTEDTWAKFDPDVLYRDVLLHVDFLEAIQRTVITQDAHEEPVTGCGVLFHELDTPEYPAGERYAPEPTYPLYVGGSDGAVSIYTDSRDKDAYQGHA